MKQAKSVRYLAWALLFLILGTSCRSTPSATQANYSSPTLVPLQTEAPASAPASSPVPTTPPIAVTMATPTPSPSPTPICPQAEGHVENGSYFSHILGRDMTYRIYLPPCYDPSNGPYPVLYLLHGYPYNERHWDQLGVDEVADNGIRSGAYPPFIIVMPSGDTEGIYISTSGGDYSVEGLVVNELIPHIDLTHPTWAAREGRAIGGISRGAVWSLEIGFHNPDTFSIVGAHSAALAVNYPHPVYDPLVLAKDPAVQRLRIYLDAGDEDWARGGVQELHQVLEEHGVPHEYVVGEGDHVNDYWSRMLPAYLAFYTAEWPAPGE